MERSTEPMSLRDYLSVLRQQRRLIALVALTSALVGVAYVLVQTPQYEARAVLQLERVRTAQDITLNELLNPSGVVGEADLAAASSVEVAAAAAELLGRDDPGVLRSKVTVTVVDGSQRLRFTATSTDPAEAAAVADAFANAFVTYRQEQAIASVAAVQTELEQRAEELRTEIAGVDAQIEAATPAPPAADLDSDGLDSEDLDSSDGLSSDTLDSSDLESLGLDRETIDSEALDSEGLEGEPLAEPTFDPEVESLQIRRQALQAQLSQVILRGTELGTSAEALTGFSAGLTPASVPTEPIGTDWVNALGVSFIFGLALGIGLAFARDHFDDVVRSESDLKRAAAGLPLLGRIPVWKTKAKGSNERLASIIEPSSHAAEAFRELSASVRFMLVAQAQEVGEGQTSHHGLGSSRSVLLASADKGEGKTATAGNLAIATARVGLRTILVDADLRRSALDSRFGLPRMRGLSDALLNGDAPDDYLVDVGVPDLRVLTAGTTPPNPTELLASPAMRMMHRRLLQSADLVIYDTPAVLAVADVLELAPYVDLSILVGRIDVTTRRRLQSALERLAQVGANISGTIVNGLTQDNDGYYFYEDYARAPSDEQDAPAPAVRTATAARSGGAAQPDAITDWQTAAPPATTAAPTSTAPAETAAPATTPSDPVTSAPSPEFRSVRILPRNQDLDEPLFESG